MKDLIRVSIYKDGGTSVWIELSIKEGLKTIEDVRYCQKYYLDNRIGSTTKGELFDKYPGDEGATMLDKSEFKFLEKDI